MPSQNGSPCCGQNFDRVFDAREAENDLRSWQEERPRLIGLVHPTDAWWVRAGASVLNALSWLLRRRDDFYIHRQAEIDRLLGGAGFEQLHEGGSRVWRVAVYGRSTA